VELRRPVREIAPGALDMLIRYSWPGNVRELRNVMRQAVLRTKTLSIQVDAVQDALSSVTSAAPLRVASRNDLSLRERAAEAAQVAERDAICEALRAAKGNKAQAARALKTDYKTLYLKIRQLAIRARDFAP
jgi:DNA-binding NtrC family response regulator